jgi:hypothetical protein
MEELIYQEQSGIGYRNTLISAVGMALEDGDKGDIRPKPRPRPIPPQPPIPPRPF